MNPLPEPSSLYARLPGRTQLTPGGEEQVADDRLNNVVAENAERNTEFMKLYFDNAEFQKAIKEAARKRAYRIITDPARDSHWRGCAPRWPGKPAC